jgi:hypothetical protein
VSDATAAATPKESGAAPYLWCSDCRTPMRDRYFALNDRPVCAKCRPPYAKRIARAEGPGAVWRVALQGALIALVGAAVLAGAISVFPPLRLFVVVPIGFLIGKRMMAALDGYSNRRYQYIAVSLTYLCFLVGFAVPSAIAEREAAARRSATRARMQGTVATEADALRDELASLTPAPRDSAATNADGTASAPIPATVLAEPVGPGPGLAFVMLLLLPFISSLQFGLMFSGIGFSAIGYALYLAWSKTDGQGMKLRLTGPFRVGQGPIQAR